jgi:hypothetical protein
MKTENGEVVKRFIKNWEWIMKFSH